MKNTLEDEINHPRPYSAWSLMEKINQCKKYLIIRSLRIENKKGKREGERGREGKREGEIERGKRGKKL